MKIELENALREVASFNDMFAHCYRDANLTDRIKIATVAAPHGWAWDEEDQLFRRPKP